MPVVNPLARELVFKIVYYGPGLGGKTTTLQHVHATARPEHRGKLVSLATPVDRTLYFDFLPIRLPHVRGMSVRLQLFTVPGQVYYNATRKLVLTGADGVVFVVDSQRLRLDASLESFANLRDNLREHGRALEDVPHVVQLNKRDLPDLIEVAELEQRFNPHAAPAFETIATTGVGVYEALEAIARAVLEDFQRRIPPGREPSVQELALPEGGLSEALRRAEPGPAEPSVRAPLTALGAALEGGDSLLPLGGPSAAPQADPGEDAARAVSELSWRVAPPARVPDDLGAASDGAAPAPAAARVSERPPALETQPPQTQPSLSPGQLRARLEAQASEPPARPAESAPSPAAGVPAGGCSFAQLWPAPERAVVERVEEALTRGDATAAVMLVDQLAARVLASAAGLLGATLETPRDPSVVALLLGLDGRRYLAFRALVRDARAGGAVSHAQALAAYALAIEARLARTRLAE
ncbi:MAG: gliding motility protein [Polyangiaceae bacterium]|nr:gliding motility protein [Polyangiaceae bacterium]